MGENKWTHSGVSEWISVVSVALAVRDMNICADLRRLLLSFNNACSKWVLIGLLLLLTSVTPVFCHCTVTVSKRLKTRDVQLLR